MTVKVSGWPGAFGTRLLNTVVAALKLLLSMGAFDRLMMYLKANPVVPSSPVAVQPRTALVVDGAPAVTVKSVIARGAVLSATGTDEVVAAIVLIVLKVGSVFLYASASAK